MGNNKFVLILFQTNNNCLFLDESSSIKSSHESYKSISEDAIDAPAEKVLDSPKKEREKFRDKVKAKLKIRPSKNANDTSDSVSIKSEDDPEKYLVFGCHLEKVEKDNEHKDIPKIILECIKGLESESNIRTSGIYRISGNKVTIDAIKKKLNDRKVAKKETSRYSTLQDQDVHTLTGLLKMFFRELKSPLMNKKVFEQCTAGVFYDKIKIVNFVNILFYLFRPTFVSSNGKYFKRNATRELRYSEVLVWTF